MEEQLKKENPESLLCTEIPDKGLSSISVNPNEHHISSATSQLGVLGESISQTGWSSQMSNPCIEIKGQKPGCGNTLGLMPQSGFRGHHRSCQLPPPPPLTDNPPRMHHDPPHPSKINSHQMTPPPPCASIQTQPFHYNSIVTRGKFFCATFGTVDFWGK